MQTSSSEVSQMFESVEQKPKNDRDVWQALIRGLRCRCPACGEGKIFNKYLKVNPTCPACGEELHHQRADDAPPYVTIFIVGHVIGTGMLITEEYWPDAPMWLHMATWPILTVLLSLWLLPCIKGGLIAYQWALRMHGFEDAVEHVPAELQRATAV